MGRIISKKILRKWVFEDVCYFDIRKRKQFIDYNDITFFYGVRGNGKSYSGKNKVVRDTVESWFKTLDPNKVKQFAWGRKSWEVIKEGITNWGDDIELKDGYYIQCFKSGIYLYHKVSIEDKKGNISEKHKQLCKLGHWFYLSSPGKFKSGSYNRIDNIVLDEFIDEFDQYLVNEPEKLMSIVTSIGRDRKVPVVCLGNNVTPENPYFTYFGLGKDDLPKLSQAISYKITLDTPDGFVDKIVGIEFTDHSAWLKDKAKSSTAGKLTAGTAYGNYSTHGQWLIDNSTMVLTTPSERMEFKWNVKLYNQDFEIHKYGKFGYYIRDGNDSIKKKIYLTLPDAESEGKGTSYYSPDFMVQIIRNAGNVNRIFFNNVNTKENFILWLTKFK